MTIPNQVKYFLQLKMLTLNVNIHSISFIVYLFLVCLIIYVLQKHFKKMDGNVRYILNMVTKH